MDKATTNQVRQVLMNELGLTRDAIREMARQLVEQEVGKAVNVLMSTGVIERIVKEKLDAIIKGNKWDAPTIQNIVTAAAKEQAAEWVKNNVRIGQ